MPMHFALRITDLVKCRFSQPASQTGGQGTAEPAPLRDTELESLTFGCRARWVVLGKKTETHGGEMEVLVP